MEFAPLRTAKISKLTRSKHASAKHMRNGSPLTRQEQMREIIVISIVTAMDPPVLEYDTANAF
jgi:hypothetical protein